jgi:hypothetical protein
VLAIVKPALLSLVFALAGAEVRAQLKAEPASLDLGRRQQEQVVTAEVKLTNAGAGPLEIVGVTADCSCTAATPDKRTLAPGESTPLKIAVQTRAYQGPLHRNIHVHTATGDLTIPIELKVSLYKSWELDPSVALIPPSPKGREAKLQIALHYVGGDKANLGEIVCTPSWLEATATGGDGKTFTIVLVKRADAPAGNHSVKVAVETSDPGEPLLSFTVFVPVTSDLRITPNPVVLPTVKVGQPTAREIVIHGWSGEGEPRLELTQGQARKMEREGDRLHFEISITPVAPGPFTQLLRIYDGEKLEAEIPVLLRAEPSDSTK